jgi:hypothetical protein
MLQQWRVMLALFPYGGSQRKEITTWAASAALWAARQPDIANGLLFWDVDTTPITMGRNRAVQAAIHNEIDILVMLDSDQAPDIDKAHPFLPSAFEFIKSRWHSQPTIISAPYLTGAATYNPVMGRWRHYAEGLEVKASLYTREEAAEMRGIQPCPLQGTGLMALDMRVFTGFQVGEEVVKLPPPWFTYEFTDQYHSFLASTEDMYFTRSLTTLFAKHGLDEIAFVDWDAWAYHVKPEFVGKPDIITIKNVAPLCKGD